MSTADGVDTAPVADAAPPAGTLPATDSADVASRTDGEPRADSADAAPVADGDAAAGLARLRGEIEQVDRRIIGLIAERVELARRVGPLKQALGMPILDPPREAAIVRRASALAREAGLDDEDVRYVFWHLVGLCRRVQLEAEGSA